MSYSASPLARSIALVLGAGCSSLALAATLTVDGPLTTTQVLSGEQRLNIGNSGSLITSGKALELKNATSGSGVIIDNSGLIQSTGDRAIDSSGSGNNRSYQILNRAGASIDASKQAIRIGTDFNGSTLSIDNAGTIISQTDRAIMLKELKTAVQVDIFNRAGGLIRGVKEDAIRLGNNATVRNYGEISTGDMTSSSAKYDGIDFDTGVGGTVENHGLISGGRHGITTDRGAALINHADGVIIGRNGSGFGSDGDGTVTNYGRISGAYNGLVADGDGDGVDIDGQGHIDNQGIIEGTGAGGQKDGAANSSEGIAMGGGTLLNRAGARISGAHNGILIDDSATGGAPHATYLENHGSILGLDGYGIRLIGEQADTLLNNGLISSSNGLALDLGGGDDLLSLLAGSQFVGLVDGGNGRDILRLDDAAGASFGDSQNFEWLDLRQGSWTLSGADFSEGGQVAAGGELINLGRIGGTLAVLSGATYRGGGQLHDLQLAAGATLGFAVAADGSHSPVQVDGQAQIAGAKLAIQAQPGNYPAQSQYRVLHAAQGVLGQFASVSSNFTFLTPELSYSADAVDLQLTRNDLSFADMANNGNASNVAGSIDAQNSPALYNALLSSSASTASSALNQLAAASNANLATATLSGSSQVGSAMQGALQQSGGGLSGSLQSARSLADGPLLVANGVPPSARHLNDPNAEGRLWLQGLDSYGRLDAQAGNSVLEQNSLGAVLGADWALDRQWRLGLLGGYSRTDLEAGSGVDGAVDSLHLGLYALRQSGPLALRLGAAYSRHDGSSQRELAFNGFTDSLRGDYQADSLQGFAELGYAVANGKWQAEPYANLGYQRYARDAYREKGGPSALRVESQEQDNLSSTLGLRAAHFGMLDNGVSFTPRLSLGWRHVYGSVSSSTRQAFLSGGSAFSVEGSALDRNSLLLDAGADFGLSSRHSLGLGYSGEMGSDSQVHALVAQWQMAF